MNMKKSLYFFRNSVVIAAVYAGTVVAAQVQWTEAELIDRIKGGMAAKMCGNNIGDPYENTDPDQNRVPPQIDWDNSPCYDDDQFMQVPFIRTCESKMNGADGINTATMLDYGAAFKVAPWEVYCGNYEAQQALKNGVLPPYSGGQPLNGEIKNGWPDAIDWQIECHWIGWSLPLMPTTSVAINDSCGHVISYATGLYAARFFVTMESIAPLYTNSVDLVKNGILSVPPGSEIRTIVDTLIDYHSKNPDQADYWNAFNWVFDLPGVNDGFQGSRGPCAIVTIALLYCNNDVQKAVEMALRMGGDTDCNCGDAAGSLGCMLGFSQLPDVWKTKVDEFLGFPEGGCRFLPDYTFVELYTSMQSIAKKAITQNGGSVSNGVYTINVQDVPVPTTLEIKGEDPVSISVATVKPGSLRIRPAAVLGNHNHAYSVDGRRLRGSAYDGVVIRRVGGEKLTRRVELGR